MDAIIHYRIHGGWLMKTIMVSWLSRTIRPRKHHWSGTRPWKSGRFRWWCSWCSRNLTLQALSSCRRHCFLNNHRSHRWSDCPESPSPIQDWTGTTAQGCPSWCGNDIQSGLRPWNGLSWSLERCPQKYGLRQPCCLVSTLDSRESALTAQKEFFSS